MQTHQERVTSAWQMYIVLALFIALCVMPDYVFAAGTDTPIGNVLCTVVTWFTGNTGKALATICVAIIGFGALLGKVSWGMAIIVGVGNAVTFGAATLVNMMNAGAASTCNTTAF